MFDIGWMEMVVMLIVAIVVIGPRDLPKAFYTVGKWVRAARRVTSDFQRHVDDMVRETELDDLKKVANQARSLNVKNQIEKAIDPTGGITSDFKSALDIGDVTGGTSKAPADTAKPSSAEPAQSIATPEISTPRAAGSPAPNTRVPTEPAVKVSAKKAAPRAASGGAKRTVKANAAPKVATPKAAPKRSAKAAAKAPNPKKTSPEKTS